MSLARATLNNVCDCVCGRVCGWGGGEPCHLLIIQRDKLGGFKDSSCDQLDMLLKGACEDSCSLSSHHQGRIHTSIGLPPSGPWAQCTSDLAKRKVKMAVFQSVSPTWPGPCPCWGVGRRMAHRWAAPPGTPACRSVQALPVWPAERWGAATSPVRGKSPKKEHAGEEKKIF